jgi:hypothetical protein
VETSLSLEEADRMLSEMAAGGHVRVEVENGNLYYVLPRKRSV